MVKEMLKISKETKEWLEVFRKVHNLETEEDAVDKLIGCYQAWNDKLFAKRGN